MELGRWIVRVTRLPGRWVVTRRRTQDFHGPILLLASPSVVTDVSCERCDGGSHDGGICPTDRAVADTAENQAIEHWMPEDRKWFAAWCSKYVDVLSHLRASGVKLGQDPPADTIQQTSQQGR